MARSVNRIILVGNAGSDPDIRETNSGLAVAHLSLATDRRSRRNGDEERQTDWHRLTFWGKSSELAARLVHRGSRLYVEGRLEYGSYQREGVEIPTADVIVHDFLVLDPAPTATNQTIEEEPALL